MNNSAANDITFSKYANGLDFNEETLKKFLNELNQHKDCPCFQDEVIRLVKDLVSFVNNPQVLPDFMFRLRIGRRRFS